MGASASSYRPEGSATSSLQDFQRTRFNQGSKIGVLVSFLSLAFSAGCGGGSGRNGPPPPNKFAVDVAVLGLWGTGGGLALTDNNNDALTVTANGTFQFPTLIESGGNYSVTVQTQPASPAQNCTVTGGSGTVTNAAVNVSVDCGHAEWAWMGGSTAYNQ